mmetsp:Transcript_40455/g.94423  ORF Transcript_40455/g.94423 Transcript_40455/m.94423 type:complete len:229 (+) Transcript_40455:159-845(+)
MACSPTKARRRAPSLSAPREPSQPQNGRRCTRTCSSSLVSSPAGSCSSRCPSPPRCRCTSPTATLWEATRLATCQRETRRQRATWAARPLPSAWVAATRWRAAVRARRSRRQRSLCAATSQAASRWPSSTPSPSYRPSSQGSVPTAPPLPPACARAMRSWASTGIASALATTGASPSCCPRVRSPPSRSPCAAAAVGGRCPSRRKTPRRTVRPLRRICRRPLVQRQPS